MKSQSFLEKFIAFIKEENLIGKDEKILLAVSGGIDSCVMLHLFSQTSFDFGIAHCNFSLRDEESDADEAFVQNLAVKYNRPFHSIRFETGQYARGKKISIQMAARELRYSWFEKLCTEFGYSKIATAHHANDSIETFIINKIRNAKGFKGKGIPVRNGKVIRPILFVERKNIEAYATAHEIAYREDSSNASLKYLRNKVRHEIIPDLKSEDENFEDSILEKMKSTEIANKLMTENLQEWIIENAFRDSHNLIHIPLAAIRKEEGPAQFLSMMLEMYGIFSIDTDKILGVKTSGKVFHSKKWDLLVDRTDIVLREKGFKKIKELIVDKFPFEYTVNESIIKLSIEDYNKEINLSISGDQLLDAAKISLPGVLRPSKPGDYFFPFGMSGKKKVSDFYTDLKLNKFDKDITMLFLSGNDIVCILGHRIDERYKITNTTKKILRISVSSARIEKANEPDNTRTTLI